MVNSPSGWRSVLKARLDDEQVMLLGEKAYLDLEKF